MMVERWQDSPKIQSHQTQKEIHKRGEEHSIFHLAFLPDAYWAYLDL
jgi:hypothetical protein